MNEDLSVYFAFLMSLGIAVFAAFSYVFSRRRGKAYDRRARSKTYHCLRCDCVYTSSEKGQAAACPICNYKNARLKF